MIESLNEEQNARIEALKASREVLAEHSGGPFSSHVRSVSTVDLIAVAGWIIDGKDPWNLKPFKLNQLTRLSEKKQRLTLRFRTLLRIKRNTQGYRPSKWTMLEMRVCFKCFREVYKSRLR